MLLLYEITGKPEYLERVQRRWREAIEGGYVWPIGGVGEKFRVSYPTDEGCSEADWLRLNLSLWRLTGDHRCLEMAERLLWNHYAMNRAPNGGYGHHNFVCDNDGPVLMKPGLTEAVWCCTFHGLLGLHTFKRYVVTSTEQGVFVNFPITAQVPVQLRERVITATVSTKEEPGRMLCTVSLAAPGQDLRLPDVFFRIPGWTERVKVSDSLGKKVNARKEGGYLRLPGVTAAQGEFRIICEFAPRVEDRRLKRLGLTPTALTRYPGVTLCEGPHLLLANTDKNRPTLVALVNGDGRLLLPRAADGTYRLLTVPTPDLSEQAIIDAARKPEQLILAPWERVRHDAPSAFVFDLIGVPEGSPLAAALKVK